MPRVARNKKTIVPMPVALQPPSFGEPQAGDIARRAYELFEARGFRDGSDLEDWLHAERELLRAATPRES